MINECFSKTTRCVMEYAGYGWSKSIAYWVLLYNCRHNFCKFTWFRLFHIVQIISLCWRLTVRKKGSVEHNSTYFSPSCSRYLVILELWLCIASHYLHIQFSSSFVSSVLSRMVALHVQIMWSRSIRPQCKSERSQNMRMSVDGWITWRKFCSK